MTAKIINISLPEELVAQIDLAAKADYASRSDYIRDSLVRRLKGQRLVSDDEGQWETLIDFKEINPKGVPAKDVLKALDRLQ